MAAASGGIESVLADVAGFQQFRRSDSRSANPSAQGATLRALGGNASSRLLVLTGGVHADHWSITNGFFDMTGADGSSVAENRYADRKGWNVSGRAGLIWHVNEAVALAESTASVATSAFDEPMPNQVGPKANCDRPCFLRKPASLSVDP